MNKGSKILTLFLVSLLVSSSVVPLEARKHHHNKKSKHQKQRGGGKGSGSSPAPAPLPDYNQTQSTIFNILSFGAKGNGVFDDSKALIAAWKAACKIPGATLQIPSDYKFLIKPITLNGPCMPQLVLQQIDGDVLAPPKVSSWSKSSLFQWLNFKWLHNFTIGGCGTVDGQGFNWWTVSTLYNNKKKGKHIPDMKPTALRFYSSYNVTVRDITIRNSPQCHLKFDNSGTVKVNNITISSPESSPNTDGIHLQNTQDVEIQHSNIGCGDDCVSIQTGCSNIHIHHITCGPGHGISLGGLGKDKSVACVSNIVVENISIQNTLSGVRIKTWQGGVGSVKNVSFSNIQVSDVKVPIMIDQYYCDKYRCKNQTGAVAISGIKYDQIIGSYTVQPIHLACSSQIPCIDVDLIGIQLNPSSGSRGFQSALCWNSYGKSQAPLVPSSIDYCLRRGSGAVRRIARSHDHACY
ncbi:polygalacturonase At1g48100 isoform X3 [Cucurbita moschata]|uniref:Polygalacturonase At1g48100 isoform X3 n=1 Tax=Cucurbita moschata TaxID=3662 RepID=A0A6J1FZB5_CUCMO|nr:polygalacturonase At1g48100 isoform X3 [Cucurbita moschata]